MCVSEGRPDNERTDLEESTWGLIPSARSFVLVSTQAMPSGVILSTYQVAGPLKAGWFDDATGGPALLTTVDEAGVKLVEGDPDQRLMLRPDDATRVIEACISAGADAALLYPRNLTDLFFDLSSGEAGAVLQKLRNYRVRLAVVCAPGAVRFSTRFSEVLAEERRGRSFGVFDTRAEAVQWLGRHSA